MLQTAFYTTQIKLDYERQKSCEQEKKSKYHKKSAHKTVLDVSGENVSVR